MSRVGVEPRLADPQHRSESGHQPYNVMCELTYRSAGTRIRRLGAASSFASQPACETAGSRMPFVAPRSEPARAPVGAEIVLVSPQSNRRLVIGSRRGRPGEEINVDLAD